jgi:hypothetical protein
MTKPTRRFSPRLPEIRRQGTVGGTERAGGRVLSSRDTPGAALARLRAWQTSRVKLISPPLFDPISYLPGEVVSPKLAAEVFGPDMAAAVNSPQLAGTVKGV